MKALRITEPSSLSDNTIAFSSLSIETLKPTSAGSQTQHAELVLLQPLAKADTLAACRDPSSRVIRNEHGDVCGPSNHELLNIRPLSLAWRQAAAKGEPMPQVTFNLTLPKEDGSTKEFQKVYWDTAMPQEGGLAVRTQDVMTLAITLATGMRMRTKGDLRFGVIYDKAEGLRVESMTSLEKQLLALARYKARGENGEGGSNAN
jgi:hypothetical protein